MREGLPWRPSTPSRSQLEALSAAAARTAFPRMGEWSTTEVRIDARGAGRSCSEGNGRTSVSASSGACSVK